MTAATVFAAGTWPVDLARSTAFFRVANLGRTVVGTVPITSGTVVAGTHGQLRAVRGTLDLGAVATGHPRRDRDLRRPRLLDLDTHPAMTFTSTAVEPHEDGWRVTGRLTARGVTAPVTGFAKASDVAGRSAVFTATARLDLRVFGLRAPRFLIGRYVEIAVTATIRHAPA